MRIINTSEIENAVFSVATEACLNITKSGEKLLMCAKENETCCNAKFALDVILDNIKASNELSIPPCQDTGMAIVFVEVGNEVFFEGKFITDAINDGVKRAYSDGKFRMSVLDPITRINTRSNTPAIIHTEYVQGDKVKITFLPKGFGSENMSRLYMLTPSAGIETVKEKIIETVKLAGSNPCPPIVVGVGIGGTMEKACFLAKKALTRDLLTPNEDEFLNSLEEELLEKINALNIGVQGFKGNNTALKVNILKFPTHISALPVAINIQCHAVRLACCEI